MHYLYFEDKETEACEVYITCSKSANKWQGTAMRWKQSDFMLYCLRRQNILYGKYSCLKEKALMNFNKWICSYVFNENEHMCNGSYNSNTYLFGL